MVSVVHIGKVHLMMEKIVVIIHIIVLLNEKDSLSTLLKISMRNSKDGMYVIMGQSFLVGYLFY
jgi:hypothetical protein